MFWPIMLIYNVTESGSFPLGPLWFTMLLVTMNNPWLTRFAEADPGSEGASPYDHFVDERSGQQRATS
jgi:hypothetical protein